MSATTTSDAAKAVVRRNTEEVQGGGNFVVFEELFAGPSPLTDTERFCAPANFFQDAFELLQLVRGKLGEDIFHSGRVLAKNRNDQFLAARGQCDDSDTTILGAFNPAYQALAIETVNRDADRSGGEIHLRSDRIDGERTLVQEHLENPEVGIT